MTRHAQMLAELEQASRDRGLLYVIVPDMRTARGCAGFPDAIVAGSNSVLAIEVKTRGAETSPAQDLWAWVLKSGYDHVVWREGEDLAPVLDLLTAVPGAQLLYG